ncbi:MAG: S8 family serine peptidase [Alphaproteobacteria bacterium]|nr:S8 family serine peptidase [Alphaproteobacteria bacterium]
MRGKIYSIILGLALAFVSFGASAQYRFSRDVATYLYEQASHNNAYMLSYTLKSGYDIDAVNERGNTAYCIAIYENDATAMRLLKRYGANTRHPCVRRAMKGKSQLVLNPRYGAVAALAAGGAIAAIAAGGGGGGKKHKKSHGSGGNDDILEGLTPVEPSYFETEEYFKGNFLDEINASTAYSRLYGLKDDGTLGTNIKNVKVGIMDTGVYKIHDDFATTNMEGFNSDYGPCLNGDSTNCWRYSDGIIYLTSDNTQRYVMSQAEYNKWVSEYDPNYDWDNNKDNFLPEDSEETMHGTHVAGIVAADKNDKVMHGVAFSNADLVVARWDFLTRPTDVISTLVDKGAKVINMSFGVDTDEYSAASLTNEYYLANKEYWDKEIVSGFLKAANKNVVMVMSAGNESMADAALYNGFARLSSLKNKMEDLFITVVATGADGKITDYSNACGVTKGYCIAAPGGDMQEMILSTGPYDVGYFYSVGTSMSAPIVAGSVALLMGAYPYMTPQQIVELILATADKSGVYADSNLYGNGMLDLDAATNPQGNLSTVSGDSIDSERVSMASTKMYVPGVFQEALQRKMPKTMTAFDKYNRPFEVAMPNMVKMTHNGYNNFKNDLYNFSRHKEKQKAVSGKWGFGFAPSSFSNNDGGLGFVDASYRTDDYVSSFFFAEDSQYMADSYQDNATLNPFLSMNEVYGLRNSFNFDDFYFKFAFMTGENGLYDGDSSYHDYNFDDRSYAFDMEIEYPIMPELALSIVGGMLAEDSALLGMNGTGALDIENSSTFYAGFLLYWQPLQNLTLSGAYYHGWTSPTHGADSMLSTSRLLSDSFAFDAHYNFNKTNVLGFQISSPLRVYDGYADFDIAVGRDNYSDTVYRKNVRASLRPSAREYKFALYHNRELLEKIMFKSEMAVRLNPDHQSGVDPDYRAMVGLSWSF